MDPELEEFFRANRAVLERMAARDNEMAHVVRILLNKRMGGTHGAGS